MKICSIIPARGGSKGIPNKNIKLLCKKPLVCHVIDTSNNSFIGKENTYVSSDSEEILSIASAYGANPILRPKEISEDSSKSEDAILHFLDQVECDICVFIQPTSPLLKPHYINEGIEKIINDPNLTSVFSVYKESWSGTWSKNREPIGWDPQNRPMRQDAGDIFIENGAFYITRTSAIIKHKLRYFNPYDFVVMKKEDSFEIDTQEDFDLVEKIMKTKN